MSRAACTVSVVTTDGAAGRAGVTVSAMASVSADGGAPSLLVCVNHQSVAARMILENGVFCVNVLRDDQAIISDRFAGRVRTSSGDKFDGVGWRTLNSGSPVLDGALVAFDCRLRQHLQHGTHGIFIGELVDIFLNESSSPLIYANRAYGRPAPLDALRHGAKAHADQLRPTLRIGCLAAPAPFIMGELLAAFAVQHPEISVELVENDQVSLIESLRCGSLSLVLTYELDLGSDLEVEHLDELRPYVLLPALHPLAQQPRVSLADLASEPMILLDLPGTREHQRGYFADTDGLSPRIGHHATSFEMVRSLVANGLGYAILVTKPAHDMSYSGKALASRPLVEEASLVRFVCVRRRDVAPEPGAREFRDLCCRHFGNVPAPGSP
jgi:flavin reductase (DIM6/NTAB) family NADH-FMN oxidoreductase RutF/DNA-binding transcriptional LysR family regulator